MQKHNRKDNGQKKKNNNREIICIFKYNQENSSLNKILKVKKSQI